MSASEKREYAYHFSDVLREETARIAEIREHRFGKDQVPPIESGFTGLALSGGGIRSAAFGLGVLHALHNQKLLRHIDYLSTVSGGGYIGSALTFFAAKHRKTDQKNDGAARADAPEPSVIGDLLGTAFVGAKTAGKEKNRRLDHIRRHGNYIIQGDRLGTGSAIAMVLRSCVVGVAIWLPILALLLAVAAILALPLETGHRAVFADAAVAESQPEPGAVPGGQAVAAAAQDYAAESIASTLDLPTEGSARVEIAAEIVAQPLPKPLLIGEPLVYLVWPALLCLLVIALDAILGCWRGDRRPVDESYKERIDQQRRMGVFLRAAVVLLVIASLPKAFHGLQYFGDSLAGSSLAAVLGSVVGAVTAFQALHRSSGKRGGAIDLGGLLAVAGAALSLYGGLLLALLFANGIMVTAVAWGPEGDAAMYAGWGVLTLLAMGSLVVAYLTDLNIIALHRFYRDRLMETFLPDPDKAGRWHRAEEAEKFWLADACKAESIGPYHLINTNVILDRSRETGYAGRGGDSFVLSPRFCGSNATGWCPTEAWIEFPSDDAGAPDRLSLATAMAVSGAAINPHAGVSGKGPTRNRLVSMAMNALNLRLGYWAPNPNVAKQLPLDRRGFTRKPTWWRILPSMAFGALNSKAPRAHSEEFPFVELSDGGHYENLGLYELVRRKVKLIVVADAGCDPRFGFADLGNAIERCRVDFGVSIRFEDEAFDLRHLAPLPSDEPLQRVFPLAKRGVAIGRIRYPGESPRHAPEMGHIVYIKTTLTEHLPADIYAYKQANPLFPDQTTNDQFFDEVQFEAYRELGYSLFENFVDEFVKAAPERTAAPLPSDRFGYGVLIDWLHGRGRWASEAPVSRTAAA